MHIPALTIFLILHSIVATVSQIILNLSIKKEAGRVQAGIFRKRDAMKWTR